MWPLDMTVVHYGYEDVGAASSEIFNNEIGRRNVVWHWYSARKREIQLTFMHESCSKCCGFDSPPRQRLATIPG